MERCDLCGIALPPDHAHLLEIESRQLVCACQACGDPVRPPGRVPLPPRRARCPLPPGFQITDTEWASLLIPIGLAFFVYRLRCGRMQAMYPGPAGPTESLLPLPHGTRSPREIRCCSRWSRDVEALLVNRVGAARATIISRRSTAAISWSASSAYTGTDFPAASMHGTRSAASSRT